MINIITSRAIRVYSIGFKLATRAGFSFNSARAHGRKLELAYIQNEIARACKTVDVSYYAANGIIASS